MSRAGIAAAILWVLLSAASTPSSARPARARGAPRRGPTTTAYATSHLGYVSRIARDAGLAQAWRTYGALQTPGLPASAWVGTAASSLGGSPGNPYPPNGTWWVERATVARYLARGGFLDGALRAGEQPSPAEYAQSTYLQGAAALRRLRESLDAIVSGARRAGLDIGATPGAWRPWELQLAVAGYSSGEGAPLSILRLARRALQAPVGERWTAVAREVLRAVAARPQGPVAGPRVAGIGGAAATVVRPRQRYETGRALAAAVVPEELPWYDSPAWPEDLDAPLSSLAAGGGL